MLNPYCSADLPKCGIAFEDFYDTDLWTSIHASFCNVARSLNLYSLQSGRLRVHFQGKKLLSSILLSNSEFGMIGTKITVSC